MVRNEVHMYLGKAESLDIVTCGHAGVCVSIYMYLPLLDRCVYATEY